MLIRVSNTLRLQERFRVSPLSQLALEVAALVDQDLAVFGEDDPRALERARRRTFKVAAAKRKAAAVAGALEFVLGGEIVRRAAEMRARNAERIEAGRVILDV